MTDVLTHMARKDEPSWPTTQPEETIETCNRMAADGGLPMITRTLAFRHARVLAGQTFERGEMKRLIYILTGRKH